MKQSLLKGGDIYIDLTESLTASVTNIYVVTAWFTDQTLLDLLVLKLKEKIEVSIVIGDNKENLKLDFSEFESLGGFLKRIKVKGYGMMHQKYCVIDEKIAVHGSYNWTVNARKNNSESVIKTNDKSIIQDLLNDYKKLIMEKEKGTEDELKEEIATESWSAKLKNKFKGDIKEVGGLKVDHNIEELSKEKESMDISLDDVFKSIISSEIKKTNRGEVKEMAYNQAKEVSGDSQVITKSMDSLYHLFVSDKKDNDDNKEKLYKKIENKVAEFIQNINTLKDEKLNSVDVEINSEEKRLEFEKTEVISRKKNKETEKKNIVETTIANLEKLILNLKDKINSLDIEFVRPMFKHHEFWPQLIFFLGLSIAMVLFYSSSAYIMLYSYDDALEAIKAGVSVNPQVYEAKAFVKAVSKGGTAIFYIMFFVFIPFAIAYISHDIKSKIYKIISYLIVVLIDIFIAVKVSTTIGEINYLSKGTVYEKSIEALFSDINFWLVFFLGAIPFFFLAELMNRLISFFAERSAQAGREKMLIERKVAMDKITVLNSEISEHKENTNNIGLEIIKFEGEIHKLEQSLIFLPKDLDTKISYINQEANNNIANVIKKADVYKNDIENDNIQISLSSLKDRVSAFIEGWNEWLHDEYANDKAINMSKQAIQASDQWLEDNMKKIEA
ncbi:phospholipase D-like domain-containing protein [Polaribacter sp.]|uniref:phospholipase D-like domain-containing protein n=1 Tax=Polaribacter sp. TaxID=1920175 RepID=UPI003EF18ADA